MTRLPAATLLLLAGLPLAAHETITTKLTWTRDIQRIFIKRCMGCHQAGGAAPFALTSWKQARPWAVAIREEVTARRMPPSNAVKGFGDIRNSMALTMGEIQLITDWANGGAPEGDPRLESDELPRLWAPAAAPGGERLRIQGSLRVERPLLLTALAPGELGEGVSLHVLLERPDGSIEPLVWLRDFRPRWAQPLLFREPVEAPAGSRLRVIGPEGAWLELVAEPVR